MDLNVKLPVFEGPLDLLLHLLEKNKVNIYDIPIAEITDQYMEYVAAMQRESAMDLMSEFMLMAATLLEIKARMLLPPDPNESEEEQDPRADLVARLLEYKMYKCMAAELKDCQLEASLMLYKPPTIPKEVLAYEQPVDLDELFGGMTLAQLNAIFQDVMKKQTERVDPIRSKFGKIQKEEISLEQRTAALESYAASHKRFSFRGILEKQHSREDVIVTFLAILELMKTGKITITQEALFADIMIESNVTEDAE